MVHASALEVSTAAALRRLLEEHARFPSLFDANAAPIGLYDLQGRAVAGNAASFAMTGRSRDEFEGTACWTFLTEACVEEGRAAFARAARGESVTIGTTYVHGSGRPISLSVNLVPAVSDGTIAGVYAIARDVTSQLDAESEADRKRQHLASLFERHTDSMMSIDAAGICTGVNAACERLTGYDAGELVGKPYATIVAPEAQASAFSIFQRVMAGETCTDETIVIHRDGRRVQVAGKALPIVVDERVAGVYVIGHDVTDQRKLESAVAEQAERIRELYLVAASAGRSAEGQIEAALDLGRRQLRCSWGYVAELAGDSVRVLHSVGDTIFPAGHEIPFDRSMVRHVMAAGEVFTVDDLREPPWNDDVSGRASQMVGFVGCPIDVGGKPFGAIGFASEVPRPEPFSQYDRDFIRLIGALAGSAIERGEQQRRLDALAFYDSLTGLPNRVLLTDRIGQTITTSARYKRRFALHYLDLDGFKEINDTYGHALGDEILRRIGRRLLEELRSSDTVARLGGDEFVILQPEIANRDEALFLAQRLRAVFAERRFVEGIDRPLTASIGIALYPDDGADGATLLDRADEALYRVKAAGRDGVCFVTGELAP